MQNHYGDDGYSRLSAIHGWLKISSNLSPPISRKQDVDRKMQRHSLQQYCALTSSVHNQIRSCTKYLSPPISRKQDVDRKNATTFSTAILCSDIVSTQSDQKLY